MLSYANSSPTCPVFTVPLMHQEVTSGPPMPLSPPRFVGALYGVQTMAKSPHNVLEQILHE